MRSQTMTITACVENEWHEADRAHGDSETFNTDCQTKSHAARLIASGSWLMCEPENKTHEITVYSIAVVSAGVALREVSADL